MKSRNNEDDADASKCHDENYNNNEGDIDQESRVRDV